jgi:hypothetical protein
MFGPMKYRSILLLAGLAFLAVLPPAAAQGVSAPIGDTLPLSGLAPGADTVYLYLTGPNLPPNGVKLDDISVPVVTGDPSTFVQASVAADGTWEYSWNTRTKGGVLDAGTYTVYVVTTPIGRTDLSSRESYAVIAVTLTTPALVAGFGGGLTISSDPSGAGVWVDGEPQGTTPLDLTNVSAGEHSIEITKEGYLPAVVNTTVNEGQNTTVAETLLPETTTVPSTLPTAPPATSIPFPLLAPLLGSGAGLLLRSVRRK